MIRIKIEVENPFSFWRTDDGWVLQFTVWNRWRLSYERRAVRHNLEYMFCSRDCDRFAVIHTWHFKPVER